MTILAFAVACLASAVTAFVLMPRLWAARIVGRDLHKPGRPEVCEMGGLAVVTGFSLGALFIVALQSFLGHLPTADRGLLLAGVGAVFAVALIGIVDDLLGTRQWAKAFLPIFAALPLVAVRAGHTWMAIPLFGEVNLSVFYPLLVVPIGFVVASNATNMLAGFNGLELGVGAVSMGSLAILAAALGETTALVILLAGLGGIAGVLLFNWYPARLLVGDTGTLSIGAIIGSAMILGNMEVAGVLLFVLHAIDFLLKAAHRFPTTGWNGDLGEDGKLHCPPHGPVSLPQLILRITGGLHERTLVLTLIGLQALLAAFAICLYLVL